MWPWPFKENEKSTWGRPHPLLITYNLGPPYMPNVHNHSMEGYPIKLVQNRIEKRMNVSIKTKKKRVQKE